MIQNLKTFSLLILLMAGAVACGQTDKEKAHTRAKEAVKLMDNGKYEESIELLKEAQKLDPDNFDYPYEIAYAHYLQKDYKGAIKYMNKYKDHENVTPNLFQLIGNSYDFLGQQDKALEAYDEGLKKFPNAGTLYLEKGNLYWIKQEFGKALPFYEKGIEMDPSFPSNYYRATRIYCGSSEEVWGMVYGEIFLNLERNTARTSEISKLLYNTYKREIKYTNDTSISVSFSQNATMTLDDISDPKNIKLPFGIGVYEPTLMFSILSIKQININSLDTIRSKFLDNYFKNGNDKKYPNALFNYQKVVKEAGHLEAYNYWILMKGDEEGFNKWKAANKDKWDKFVSWFNENGMKVSASNRFYRMQY